MIVELDKNNFNEAIKRGLKVVEFYMPTCPYCIRQQEVLNDMENIWIGKVNSQNSPSLIEEYDILSFPTFIIFNNGIEHTRFSGLRTKEQLLDKFLKYIP